MPKFDLYEKPFTTNRRGRPWNPLRIVIWTMLFASLSLWLYGLWIR